ncbi:MAG: acyltransferase [Candidatus Rokubacteria bacterium]|nr:acyltransferase [Candidatus Rokubacteria bacterium]
MDEVGPGAPSGRLVSIDALRGLAALGVVAFHAGLAGAYFGAPGLGGRVLAFVASFGGAGVWLFFVISGFCIHLRWAKARASGQAARVDFLEFWRRRIRRLYPPYLVALAAYVAVLAVEGRLAPSPFSAFDVGMHLLMLHNLDGRTVFTLNGVFWTLAIEEQLYLAYFLLLRLRARWGWPATIGCCLAARAAWFALALVVHRVFGAKILVTEAAAPQWFIWALGALSVEAALGLVRLPPWTRSGWLAVGGVGAAGAVSYALRVADPAGGLAKLLWLVGDPLWGIAFFVVVNAAVGLERRWTLGRAPGLVGLLAAVGFFSYSLYLTHELVLAHAVAWIRPGLPFVVGAVIFSALSVAVARAFFQVFERPFLSRAAVSPGPGVAPVPS